MAQTGYTPIQLYYSSTTTNVPLAANLAYGELAINITDGKLFYKDNANAIQVIGWKVVPATAGGTGQTSYAVGDLIYANTTTTLAKLADVATGNALISGGVNTAPSWGKIGLTTHVSGTLPVSNGGTGTTTAFTAGSVVFAGASGVYSQDNANLFWDDTNNRLGVGTAAPGRQLELYNSGASPVFRWNDGTNTWDIRTNGSVGSAMQFDYSGTRYFTLLSGGDFQNNTGNYVPVTAAKGINFTANTPAAGKTSQLLNWYEEGTWTPVLTAATAGNFTPTYTTQEAAYTRVGRLVTVTGRIYLTSFTNTTGSGDLFITGLPFTPSGYYFPGSLEFAGVTKVGYTQFTPFATPGQTYLRIDCSSSATAVTTLQVTDLTVGGRPYFVFQITYQV